MNECYSSKIDDKKIDEIHKKLVNYKIKNRNNHMLYFFNYKNTYITIYRKKTILIQGENVQQVVKFLSLIKNQKYKFDTNFKFEIGSDETGTGDFFGGITVCSVKVNLEKFDYLKETYKIDDSKKLTDDYISSIWMKLKNEVTFKLYSLSPREYNNSIKEYKNANVLKAVLHNRVLKNLFESNSKVIIDQFVNEKKYYEYLKEANLKKIVKVNVFETKAESKYLSVAIASIIARGWQLRKMEQLSSKIGLNLPLGSSNDKIILIANMIIKNYSKNMLYKVCKIHFKTINQLNIENKDEEIVNKRKYTD